MSRDDGRPARARRSYGFEAGRREGYVRAAVLAGLLLLVWLGWRAAVLVGILRSLG